MTIPKEIIEAAQKIHNWATEQGMERYEIGPICSRNFADDLRAIEQDLKQFSEDWLRLRQERLAAIQSTAPPLAVLNPRKYETLL